MRTKKWIGCVLVLACLGLSGCKERDRQVPLTTASEDARNLYSQGLEALDTYRLDEARSYFAQAVEKDPTFAMAHLALAEIATTPEARRESLKAAVGQADAVSKGERLVILGADAGVNRDAAVQLDLLIQAVQLYPDDARLHVRVGDFYVERANYADSVQAYLDAREVAPDYSVPYQRMGRVYQIIGRLDHAERAYDLFIEENSSAPGAHLLRAQLLMKAGRLEESTAVFEKVLDLDPDSLSARIGLGNNLLFQDKIEEALALFRKLYDEANDDARRRTALRWVAATHVHAGDDDKALEELQRAFELAKPEDVDERSDLLELMGNVLLEGGHPDRAMVRFAEARAVVEEADVSSQRKGRAQRDFLYYDARVVITKGNHPNPWEKVGALRDTARTRSFPGVADRFNELGARIALTKGNYEMALRKLTHADEADPRVVYMMALAYQGLEKKGDAQRTCAKAMNFNEPRFEVAFVRDKARKLLAEM